MFDWKDSYSVNIPSIDGQHRNLFRMAGELYTAMTSGQGKAALGRILDRLVEYTRVHFEHEERLMRQSGFPGLAQHAAEHRALTRQVEQFQADFASGRTALSVQLLQFLKDWLERHIQGSDQAYAPCLAEKGVA
jgi:hemerythrin